jgi:hypothetical protein
MLCSQFPPIPATELMLENINHEGHKGHKGSLNVIFSSAGFNEREDWTRAAA